MVFVTPPYVTLFPCLALPPSLTLHAPACMSPTTLQKLFWFQTLPLQTEHAILAVTHKGSHLAFFTGMTHPSRS